MHESRFRKQCFDGRTIDRPILGLFTVHSLIKKNLTQNSLLSNYHRERPLDILSMTPLPMGLGDSQGLPMDWQSWSSVGGVVFPKILRGAVPQSAA